LAMIIVKNENEMWKWLITFRMSWSWECKKI
jgi:hypothetical protein